MRTRVQILGSTRLARVALPYLLERRNARIVGLDPGEEDEGLPWSAPVRGLCRDNGVPLGRHPADVVLDLDPDARPTAGEGVMVRVLAPPGARSPDLNRALLRAGEWEMVVTDGTGAWGRVPVVPEAEDDGERIQDQGTLRGVEALDAAWDAILAGPPTEPLPRPLIGGRWRPQESFVVWEQDAASVVARVRAAAGPWGGARANLGETAVWLLDARVVEETTPAGFTPGTIVALSRGLDVATGRGTVRIERLRPGWRPPRSAGSFATESGLSPGYQFA